jgi:hypothetical protein
MNPEVILPAMLREERARNLAPELVEDASNSVVALEEAANVFEGHGLKGLAGIMRQKAAATRALLAKIDGEQA